MNVYRRREQRQPDQRQQFRNMALPRRRVVLHPRHERVEDVLLRGDVEVVAFDQIRQLLHVQLEELLILAHVHEVIVGVLVGQIEEREAALLFGEQREPDAVGRVELLRQEVAAGRHHRVHLQEARGRQQRLHVLLAQVDPPRVAVLDEHFERLAEHVAERDLLLLRLAQRGVEHRAKVRTCGRQNEAMRRHPVRTTMQNISLLSASQ